MNGLLAIARQPLENCPARRIGKRLEDVICDDRHEETITKWLLIVKRILRTHLRQTPQLSQAPAQKFV